MRKRVGWQLRRYVSSTLSWRIRSKRRMQQEELGKLADALEVLGGQWKSADQIDAGLVRVAVRLSEEKPELKGRSLDAAVKGARKAALLAQLQGWQKIRKVQAPVENKTAFQKSAGGKEFTILELTSNLISVLDRGRQLDRAVRELNENWEEVPPANIGRRVRTDEERRAMQERDAEERRVGMLPFPEQQRLAEEKRISFFQKEEQEKEAAKAAATAVRAEAQRLKTEAAKKLQAEKAAARAAAKEKKRLNDLQRRATVPGARRQISRGGARQEAEVEPPPRARRQISPGGARQEAEVEPPPRARRQISPRGARQEAEVEPPPRARRQISPRGARQEVGMTPSRSARRQISLGGAWQETGTEPPQLARRQISPGGTRQEMGTKPSRRARRQISPEGTRHETGTEPSRRVRRHISLGGVKRETEKEPLSRTQRQISPGVVKVTARTDPLSRVRSLISPGGIRRKAGTKISRSRSARQICGRVGLEGKEEAQKQDPRSNPKFCRRQFWEASKSDRPKRTMILIMNRFVFRFIGFLVEESYNFELPYT
jgi:hypothetical protein